MIQKRIEALKVQVNEMIYLVMENLKKTFSIILEKADVVIEDDLIDEKEVEIKEQIIEIIVRERPYGNDLRTILAFYRLVGDLERIGDLALNIYENTEIEKTFEFDKNLFKPIMDKALTMIENSIVSLYNGDVKLAKRVIKDDDIIDKLYLINLTYYLNQKATSVSIKEAVVASLMLKYIERVADHATNIAEYTIFIQGEKVNKE